LEFAAFSLVFEINSAGAEINIDESLGNSEGWTIGYNNSLKGCCEEMYRL
jgi:hypothetical protein